MRQQSLQTTTTIRRGASNKNGNRQKRRRSLMGPAAARTTTTTALAVPLPLPLLCTIMLACCWLSVRRVGVVHAFQQRTATILGGSGNALTRGRSTIITTSSILQRSMAAQAPLTSRVDADRVEQLVGGERYSLVPMPDSMTDTTVYVGNLCEFVDDGALSQFFAAHSVLSRVPAVVVRKPDTQSMQYGFVSFPSRQEKEAAILRFHGREWRGRALRVECIRDHPKRGRVRVPEQLVEYVSGQTKRTRGGEANTLRRISRDDVDRLSRGQPSKRRGYGSRGVPHRLNEPERAELDRAATKGYLTVTGTGNRRTRKGSPLANIHRQWCDARAHPQIVLHKAVGGDAVDQVVIDLAPLRLQGLWDDADAMEEEFTIRWKTDILREAHNAGMELRDHSNDDDNDDENNDDDDDGESSDESVESSNSFTITIQGSVKEAWATQPIWKLPVVSIGVFIGERSKAKAMASALAKHWGIPEPQKAPGQGARNRRTAGAKKGGRTKMKGLSSKRRQRGGGHRQAW